MEYKLQKEAHNRQDKAKKPDYREDFAEDSARKATRQHVEVFRDGLAVKEETIRLYDDGHYFVGSRLLCLADNLASYAERNSLDDDSLATRGLYEQHRKIAELDRRTIMEAVRGGEVVWDRIIAGKWTGHVEFHVRTRCDSVAPRRTTGCEQYPKVLHRKSS